MHDPNFLASSVFVLSLLGIGAYLLYRKIRGSVSRIDVAMEQFLKSTVHSENPMFAFEGRSAIVVRNDEDRSNGESTTYALTVDARNPHGEYFVFRSDGKTSSVSHLEHRLARVVLKHEYSAT